MKFDRVHDNFMIEEFDSNKSMSIGWKKENVRLKLMELMNNIRTVALEDTVISNDEETILEGLKWDILQLEDEISQIIEDGMDKHEASLRIKQLFENVIDSSAKSAKDDGTITAEELVMIDKLAKYLRNMDASEFLI